MKITKTGFYQGMWEGKVNGSIQIVNVVGTYGVPPMPIVRVEEGKDAGKCFVINWNTGNVIVELSLK